MDTTCTGADPSTPSRLAAGATVAGIDIGGTSIKSVLVGPGGTVLASKSAPTPVGGKAMARTAARMVRTLAEQTDCAPVAVGLGAAGGIDPVARMVTAASDTFVDWAGFPIGQFLDDALGIPSTIANDVNAFMIGEMRAGAGQGLSNAFGVTLGTGVGGALVLEGRLFTGSDGLAGEIGHTPGFFVDGYGEEPCTCGQVGHLEAIASARSIVRRYEQRGGRLGLTCQEVAERALAEVPDAAARQVFIEAGSQLGRAAVMIATLLSISDVIIGGGVAGAWPLLAAGLDDYVTRRPSVCGQPIRAVPSQLGGLAVAIGAAELARDSL